MDRQKVMGENFMLWMIHLEDLRLPSPPRTTELEVLLNHTRCPRLSGWKKIWPLLGTMWTAIKLHFTRPGRAEVLTWELWTDLFKEQDQDLGKTVPRESCYLTYICLWDRCGAGVQTQKGESSNFSAFETFLVESTIIVVPGEMDHKRTKAGFYLRTRLL